MDRERVSAKLSTVHSARGAQVRTAEAKHRTDHRLSKGDGGRGNIRKTWSIQDMTEKEKGKARVINIKHKIT